MILDWILRRAYTVQRVADATLAELAAVAPIGLISPLELLPDVLTQAIGRGARAIGAALTSRLYRLVTQEILRRELRRLSKRGKALAARIDELQRAELQREGKL